MKRLKNQKNRERKRRRRAEPIKRAAKDGPAFDEYDSGDASVEVISIPIGFDF
jgi:hypothetical protein